MSIAFTYLPAWLLLAVVAVANGSLRQFGYGRYMSELAAHQVSTVTGILFTGIVAWAFSRFFPIESAQQARIIGASWLAMTLAFEFGFGHYVAGHSWRRLLTDYNLLAGRLWVLFLAWIAALPLLLYHLQASGT
ncbi:MAG: hypothetical protein OEW35_12760 [Gammaproteobacteria bacterium]|nr:hypothetical protein [Gammaproteobacteria bacterium]MDH4255291.1 hypothetical protein [Gammaproteobacteria bacterium]MDH5310931.1 hypothetical protein [Gammaproteobacteria bacterium]